jgi:hypothetical protein
MDALPAKNILTRRANQRHNCIIAQFVRPAATPRTKLLSDGFSVDHPDPERTRSLFDLLGSPVRREAVRGHCLAQRECAFLETFILQDAHDSRLNASAFGIGRQPDSRIAATTRAALSC